MSKIDLDTLASGYQSTTSLNDNFQSIEDELNNKVLYRDNPDGEANEMLNDLDMNSQRMLNLPSATSRNEPATYGQLLDAASGITSITTLSEEQTASSNGQSLFTFTSITYTPGAKNLTVYRNGAKLPISSYTETSASSITLSAANAAAVKAGDEFEFIVNQRDVDSDTYLASNATYTPAGSGATTSDVQTKLRERVSVKDFGAVGDGVTDDTSAITNAIASGAKYIEFGDSRDEYKITSDIELVAARSDIILQFNGAKLSPTSSRGIYIPAVGDGISGVAGASNVIILGANIDGTNSAANSVGIVSYNADGLTVKDTQLNNWNLSGSVIYGLASGACSVHYENIRATGNTNHGVAVSTVEVDASRIVLNGVKSWTNGLGIDISAGSATVSDVYCWDNTNGGMKTAGGDEQHLILSNADLSNNTGGSAQGFYTNGTFRLLEFSNIRCNNNGSNGIQLGHAGNVVASNIVTDGNGGIGFYQSGAADSLVENLISRDNTGRGSLISAGTCQIGKARTESNGNVGINVGDAEDFYLGSLLSVDDCLTTNNASLLFNPSTGGRYEVGSVISIDTGGASLLTIGVSLNANCTDASIQTIRTSGVTNAISDSGTDTVYMDAMGQCKLPPDRIGFYGGPPRVKQTVTGSRGGNAALASLLTALDTLGLITDSSS